MLPDSFVLTSNSLSEFYRRQPIDFFLYDEEGNPYLYMLNDNVPGKTHHLILINESEQDLVLQPAARDSLMPGPDNFHFELRFRPGTLAPEFFNWITVGGGEWRIQPWRWKGDPVVPDETVSLFLLYHLDTALRLPARSSKLVLLHGIKAGTGSGSRGAGAELRYRSTAGTIIPSQQITNSKLHFRQDRLEILNQRGVKEVPVRAGFAGADTVLNDGRTNNHLSIQLTNTLRNNVIPLLGRRGETSTRMVLSFDTSELAEHWALLDEDNAANVLVEINDQQTYWHIEKENQGQTVQWILAPDEDLELDAGNSMRIHLSQLISDMPAGATNLYLIFENMPGYWDGMFTLPLEKSPFYLEESFDEKGNPRRAFLGLGTRNLDTQDSAALLQVEGGVSAGFIQAESLLFDEFEIVVHKEGDNKYLEVKQNNAVLGGFIPRGGIIMWSGTENAVPPGWTLCIGGTINGLAIPDLRSRFIVGAGQGPGLSHYAIHAKGGEETHTLTKEEMPRHKHEASSDVQGNHHHGIPVDHGGGGNTPHNSPILWLSDAKSPNQYAANHDYDEMANTQNAGSHTHTIKVSEEGEGTAHENRPPYYALAFIIKL